MLISSTVDKICFSLQSRFTHSYQCRLNMELDLQSLFGLHADSCIPQPTEYRKSAKLFLQSSRIGTPHPRSRRRVCPPPLGPGGGGTLACGKRVGRVPVTSDERTYTVVFYKYSMYFVPQSQPPIPAFGLIYEGSISQPR